MPPEPAAEAAAFSDGFGSLNTTVWRLSNSDGTVETNGSLQIRIPSPPSSAGASAGLLGNCSLHGDFDMQVHFQLQTWSPLPDVYIFLSAFGFNLYRTNAGGEKYGVHRFSVIKGEAATTNLEGSLRVTRTGSSMTGYYLSGGDWVTVGTDSSAGTTDAFFNLTALRNAQADGLGDLLVSFDNFVISTGELNCPNAPTRTPTPTETATATATPTATPTPPRRPVLHPPRDRRHVRRGRDATTRSG